VNWLKRYRLALALTVLDLGLIVHLVNVDKAWYVPPLAVVLLSIWVYVWARNNPLPAEPQTQTPRIDETKNKD